MAKLSAHGIICGTISYLLFDVRFMSDRQVLINRGDGWTLYRRVKTDVSPTDAFIHARDKYNTSLLEHPSYAEFRKALHQASGIYGRWFIYQTIESMPTDPDGVWATLDDSYDYKLPKLTIDECVELCKLFQLAEIETKETHEKS